MSDEQRQQVQVAQAEAQAETTGDRWGDPISEERQAELQDYLDRWQVETDHGDRAGPFDLAGLSYQEQMRIALTGADASWLAEQSRRDPFGAAPNLHLEGAALRKAHLESADLEEAHLEGADLIEAHLESADLEEAHLEGARFLGAHLEGATLRGAHLEGAELLGDAHLEGATLDGAHLEGAHLGDAHLEGAALYSAHLEGAALLRAHLERADLTGASFDKTSQLNDAVLTGTSFDQVSFDNTNLTVVDWSRVDILGDERTARERKDSDGNSKTRKRRLDDYKAAVRANRVLAVALQAQGLSEDAARFAYRAQLLQRRVHRLQRKPGAFLFSLLLAALAGYGYRLWRIFASYGLTVALFAAGYLASGILASQGQVPTGQNALDALQISLNAIHGRVFFAQFHLDTLQSWLATVESIIGIVIEGVFVAMLIQRFFGR